MSAKTDVLMQFLKHWYGLYTKCIVGAKISPVFPNLFRIPDRIWVPLHAPWALGGGGGGGGGGNDQARAHLGPKASHMAFEPWKSVQ